MSMVTFSGMAWLSPCFNDTRRNSADSSPRIWCVSYWTNKLLAFGFFSYFYRLFQDVSAGLFFVFKADKFGFFPCSDAFCGFEEKETKGVKGLKQSI